MNQNFLHIDSLAQKIKQGNVQSFQSLYALMSHKIFHYAYSFVLSKEEAEEIMHDVFLRIWDKRKEIDTQKSLSGFIYTIAKNLALDRVRKYSLASIKLEQYFRREIKDPGNFVEQEVIYNELSQTIHEIIMQMPSSRKKVYQLSRVEGMSNKAIAEYLSISVTSVEKHIRLALDNLRFELRKRKWHYIIILFCLSFL